MALYDYSFSTVDPKTGFLRTFSITTDSRSIATIEIRRAVQAVNSNRVKAGAGSRLLLAIPDATDLYADVPTRTGASQKVAIYA